MKKVGLLIAVFFVFTVFSMAAVETKFYGFQWIKYNLSYTGASQTSSTFCIPRTYLRWKMKDAEMGWEGNLTLDVNNDQYGQEVTTTASTGNLDWAAFIKHGYVVLNKIPLLSDAGISLKVGLQPTYYGVIDTWWSPLIERCVEDIRGVISAADQGIIIDGTIPAGFGSYQAGIYNGTGYRKMESDFEKMALARVIITPIKEAYLRASYFRNITGGKLTASTDFVIGGAVGPVDGFAEYVVKAGDITSIGWSGYLNYNITDPLSFMIRYDNWKADTRQANVQEHVYIAGINYKIMGENVLLQLNYQMNNLSLGSGVNTYKTQYLAQIKWSW